MNKNKGLRRGGRGTVVYIGAVAVNDNNGRFHFAAPTANAF